MELQGDIVFLRNEILVDKEFPTRAEIEGFGGVGGKRKKEKNGGSFHETRVGRGLEGVYSAKRIA
jgi:hypothetical protein